MARTQTNIQITHGTETIGTVKYMLHKDSSKPHEEATQVSRFFDGASIGNRSCYFTSQVTSGDEAFATGAFTFSAAASPGDTVLINGVTFTAVSSGATGNQWNVGGSATGTAADIAAQAAASAAYTSMAGMTSTPISHVLDGHTYSPGVYSETSGTFDLAGTAPLVLNGAGDYIFIAASTLTTGSTGTPVMTLSGGATADRVYWIVGSAATINSGHAGTFQGSIIAQTSITDTSGGTVNGSLIALTGAVTLSATALVNAQQSPNLGVAGFYGILGASAVTGSTGAGSTVTGNVSSYPTHTITNFPPSTFSLVGELSNSVAAANLAAAVNASASPQISGTVTATSSSGVVTVTAAQPGQMGNSISIAKGTDLNSVNSAAGSGQNAKAAQADALATYNSMSAMSGSAISATLDSQTLVPGVYTTGAAHLATSGAAGITFSGAGVYIIICSSTLVTGAGGTPTMTLSGGATAANIYWIVGSSATINSGFTGTFQGNVIALTSIADTLGGTVNGSLVALNGAVTLAAATTVNAKSAPFLPVAGYYGLLAGTTVTNSGSTVVSGNVGVFPGTSITGFPPGTFTLIAPHLTGGLNPTTVSTTNTYHLGL
jgi:hypothetical protein